MCWTRKDFYAEWDYWPADTPAAVAWRPGRCPWAGGVGDYHCAGRGAHALQAERALPHVARCSTRLEDKLANTEEGRRLLAERLAAKAAEADGAAPAAESDHQEPS
ncbi:MAG: hypothetical protein ACRDGH_15530 [Candidatus Limnocylindria bacterium]